MRGDRVVAGLRRAKADGPRRLGAPDAIATDVRAGTPRAWAIVKERGYEGASPRIGVDVPRRASRWMKLKVRHGDPFRHRRHRRTVITSPRKSESLCWRLLAS